MTVIPAIWVVKIRRTEVPGQHEQKKLLDAISANKKLEVVSEA
jgi:hypothetical protein